MESMTSNTLGLPPPVYKLTKETEILADAQRATVVGMSDLMLQLTNLVNTVNNIGNSLTVVTNNLSTLTTQVNNLSNQVNSIPITKTVALMNTAAKIPIGSFGRGRVMQIWGAPMKFKPVREYWSVTSPGRYRLWFKFAADIASITSDFQNALLPSAVIRMMVKTGNPYTAVDYNTILVEGDKNYSQAGGGVCSPTLISVPDNMSMTWEFTCDIASDASQLNYHIAFVTCEDFDHSVFSDPRMVGHRIDELGVDPSDTNYMMTDGSNYSVDCV